MSHRVLIGTDEAGYGPNLGPLTITATAWQVPVDLDPMDLWEQFADVLTNTADRKDRRLFVADSKAVFMAGAGLEDLEVAVLAFLRTLQHCTDAIVDVGEAVAGSDFLDRYREEFWNIERGVPLPCDACADHVHEWHDALEQAMQQADIRLLSVRSRILFPKEFNELVTVAGSKGGVLSNATLTLVRHLVDQFGASGPITIVCDKHGGRNRYDELIALHFDDQFVFRLEESRERSRYRMGQTEFCFRTKAEQLLPVALSSMVSKYLREVLMGQFNAFWATHVPGLKPTQGYPLDARRFRNDIDMAFRTLKLEETLLWRSR